MDGLTLGKGMRVNTAPSAGAGFKTLGIFTGVRGARGFWFRIFKARGSAGDRTVAEVRARICMDGATPVTGLTFSYGVLTGGTTTIYGAITAAAITPDVTGSGPATAPVDAMWIFCPLPPFCIWPSPSVEILANLTGGTADYTSLYTDCFPIFNNGDSVPNNLDPGETMR